MGAVFFYILAFLLIGLSILVIASKRIYASIIAAIVLFFVTGFLYLLLNSILAGIFQTVIFGILTSVLLIITYNYLNENKDIEKNEFQIVKKPRVILSILFTMLLIIFVSMLVYYFTHAQTDEVTLYFVEDLVLSKGIGFFVNIKSIFINYILSYGLVILALVASIIGVGILIPKKGGNNG